MTLAELDSRMADLAQIRREIVRSYFEGGKPQREAALLAEIRQDLGPDRRRPFETETGDRIDLDLSYETEELERDLLFVSEGEEAVWSGIAGDAGPASQAAGIARYILENGPFVCWITDRDGTVNNYCGRYRSSIQPAYNAVALTRFASACAGRSVLLSSAPLSNGGLIDVSVLPHEKFVFAGSKGREYRDERGRNSSLPVSAPQALALQELNALLADMVKEPEYALFSRIGSGLQLKFGQTTIARQDIFGSIDSKRSQRFLDRVTRLVRELDPSGSTFRIEDTGKDVEIMLTVENGQAEGGVVRDFDKGDGVAFLDVELALGVSGADASVLVCGDTASDVAMVRETAFRGAAVSAIFVTEDERLKAQVRSMVPEARFARNPDLLVAALRTAAAYKEGSHPKPGPSAG